MGLKAKRPFGVAEAVLDCTSRVVDQFRVIERLETQRTEVEAGEHLRGSTSLWIDQL
jgi:hypothetical protein